MPTLILSPRHTADSNRMWKAALDAGWNIERLPSWRAPEPLRHGEVAFYGEPLFAAALAEQVGLLLAEPPPDWLARLSPEFRRREVRFCSLEEARLFERPAFIKPAADKSFEARLYRSGAELPEFAEAPTLVLIAEPVRWEVEFRCFVLDDEVVTLSPYWRGGRTAQDEAGLWPCSPDEEWQALEFASRVLASDPSPGRAAALDVGVIEARGWAVVEANAAWGSGLYGCDAAQVLRVVQHACARA